MADVTQLARIPPQNNEAEMSLLGSILLDKDAMLNVADMVDPEDFYHRSHALIFESIRELYAKNEPIDVLTLGNRLEEKKQLEEMGGRSILVKLSNSVPTASHVKQYAEIVKRKATLRKLLRAADEITR
ncbi:MAG: replicative DNA helicase, partial [Candidatus Pacebacteria bacterium CG10_big_fil_rev_8_21_14_0_10_45_6]